MATTKMMKCCADQTCSVCLAGTPQAREGSETLPGGGFIATGPHAVARVRVLALRSALKLESVGLKMSRGRSALKVVREEFGIKARTALAALPLYETLLRERGILSPAPVRAP